jgi:hypothetical protein
MVRYLGNRRCDFIPRSVVSDLVEERLARDVQKACAESMPPQRVENDITLSCRTRNVLICRYRAVPQSFLRLASRDHTSPDPLTQLTGP